MSLLRQLLPPMVVVEELRDHPAALDLYPEELAVVAGSVDKRRREFAAARECARRALAALGRPAAPIVPGPHGAPGWPPGVVGSMTHCPGFAAAALANETDVAALGIDAEPDAGLPAGVLERISLPRELSLVRQRGREWPHIHWDRLLFSSKEATYKAWFPLMGAWLDFDEAVIDLHPIQVGASITLTGGGTFWVRLLVPGPVVQGVQVIGFSGTWASVDGILATAIAVEQPATGDPRRGLDGGLPRQLEFRGMFSDDSMGH